MKQGKPLDFVRKAKRIKSKFYNASDIFRECDRCGNQHSLFYKRFKNGRLVLCMACPTSKPRTEFLKFEAGLNIPILEKGKRETSLLKGNI